MLGIHGVGRDRADYYLADLAHELPVSSPGRWTGEAAARLGWRGRYSQRSSVGCSWAAIP